jgi:8-oxo-dGTP pyrophosphatase MutT (NUDIX family)
VSEILRSPAAGNLLRRRLASRILLLDAAGRILLFRFEAPNRPVFWATPGGELEPEESFAAAARRELREETGIDCDCGTEVARRDGEFVTLEGEPVISEERYFLVRTQAAEVATQGHTELERRVMRSWRWFRRDEIAGHDEMIFPVDLAELLDTLPDGG